MAITIHSKKIADGIIDQCSAGVGQLASKGIKPGLAFVLVGDDRASHTYVKLKRKLCDKIGIGSPLAHLDADSRTADVVAAVRGFNKDPACTAILVQLPLPASINTTATLSNIDPRKDVDGLHPLNQGLLALGIENQTVPCTPQGCMRLIQKAGIEARGKRAVVVGRSRIVGRPMASLLFNAGASVSICHSKTKDLAACCKRADILVIAAGSRHLVDGAMVKENAMVVDVGINHDNGSVTGDVDTESAAKVASVITPVPGGVGPMTLAMLMKNTVELAERQYNASVA